MNYRELASFLLTVYAIVRWGSNLGHCEQCLGDLAPIGVKYLPLDVGVSMRFCNL